ncbi:MAG: hypothetical protein WA160_08360 [Pseudobdellovibrio sp.]
MLSIQKSLFKIFTNIQKLSFYSKWLTESIQEVHTISKKIKCSALNTIIKAERLGVEGRTLSIVAEHIAIGAAESKKINTSIRILGNKVLGNLEEIHSIQFTIGLASLQTEMLTYFSQQD